MNYFWNLLKNIDKTLLLLPIIFAIISVVMVGSTMYDGAFIFTRAVKIQIVAYGLGFIAIGAMVFIDYKLYEGLEKIIYIGSILFLLTVYVPGLGVVHYGARSWINLGVTDFQPSELVKIFFVILMATYLSRNRDNLHNLKGVLMAALYASPFIVIILLEDMGNAIVFCAIWIAMVFYAGIDYKLFLKLAGLALVSLPIIYRFMASHQKDRISAFLHPENLSIDANYQVLQSKIAIGSGGFFGKGLFQGTQKQLDFLPVKESDFIFAVIVEELGMLGGMILIGLYTFFLYRIAKIVKNAKDLYGALIAAGFMGMFGFQIFENIAMTMGLMPVTGITLPFISYGGSSILTNMTALGLILSIGMRSKSINF